MIHMVSNRYCECIRVTNWLASCHMKVAPVRSKLFFGETISGRTHLTCDDYIENPPDLRIPKPELPKRSCAESHFCGNFLVIICAYLKPFFLPPVLVHRRATYRNRLRISLDHQLEFAVTEWLVQRKVVSAVIQSAQGAASAGGLRCLGAVRCTHIPRGWERRRVVLPDAGDEASFPPQRHTFSQALAPCVQDIIRSLGSSQELTNLMAQCLG